MAFAASLPYSPSHDFQQNKPANYNAQPVNNLSFVNQQLSLFAPFNLGVTHSDLTGTYLNGRYVLPLGNKLALGALGEYGSGQYRINGTIGYELTPHLQMKFTSERLGQRLPFQFDSGAIDTKVHQDAYGARFQQLFDLPFLQAINAGGYYAKAANKELAPIQFTSNGSNCGGFGAGLQCINYRNIAGATSLGIDAGADLLLSPATLVSANLYYDEVRYNPIFSAISDNDRDGFGAGVKINQLLTDRFKLLGEANAREIYNTYQAGVSWLPLAKKTGMGLELSLLGQHITSHNTTPNNNSVSLQINFLADGTKNYGNQLATERQSLNTIAQWVEAPAVKMNQVLVIAEQITRLLGPGISSISPSSGSFAGGNIITISGSNFIQGLLVLFGDTVATNIQVLSPTLIQVTVPASPTPPSATPESVVVVVQNPDGQQISQPNGYTYIDGNVNPVITTIQPTQGPAAGGQLITITGSNLAGTTGVTFDNNTVVPTSVSPTQVTVITPAHSAGSVDVTVSTAQGSTTIPNGYTYLLPAPIVYISDDGLTVFGTGSPGTTAKVVDAAGNVLGEAPVASDGSFNITLTPPQTNGQTLTVTVEDTDGTSSEPTSITAPDTTAPDAPTNVVISSDGTVITGQGEADTTVRVTDSAGGQEIVTGTVDSNGDFSLNLNPPQIDGEVLSVTLIDAAGNSSPSVSVTAPTPPAAATALEINPTGTVLTGFGEAGATVSVTNAAGNDVGTGTIASDGSFSLSLSPAQIDGGVLSVILTNAAGSSAPVAINAPDLTPPAPPTNLAVSANGLNVTGRGEAGTTV